MALHLYDTFYHKISGDLMHMWMPHVNGFCQAVWSKISGTCSIHETTDTNNNTNISSVHYLNIPQDSFRIFGFLDNTGFCTTAPGIETRRRYGFYADPQRSFYSAYFEGHGIKKFRP